MVAFVYGLVNGGVLLVIFWLLSLLRFYEFLGVLFFC